MNKNEVQELLKVLSQAINLSDKLDLGYGDELMQMIIDIKERYSIDD